MRNINEFDILIVPGRHDSGPDHWQTYWESVLPNTRRVEQDEWDAPNFSDWSRRLSEVVSSCDRPILLVAHSLGTALVTRWAVTVQPKTVAGAFLVATSDIDRFAGTSGYPVRGFDPIVMKPLPFPSIVLASRNDEKVSLDRSRAFATAWRASFVDVGDLGHIGSFEKLGVWPIGLVWFGQFVSSIQK